MVFREQQSALRAQRLRVPWLAREHRGQQRLCLGRLLQRHESLGQVHARSSVVLSSLCERDLQLTLRFAVASKLTQQLAVVLTNARTVGVELERSLECLPRSR